MMEYSILDKELEVIIEKSHDNILIADNQGIILKVGPNVFSAYGCDSNEFIGQSVYQLEQEKILSPSITAMVIKYQTDIQVMQKTLKGHFIMAEGFPIFDSQGKLIRVVTFGHDITDMKLLREEYEYLQKKTFQSSVSNQTLSEAEKFGIWFVSKTMKNVFELLQRVASSDVSILLSGESGVGKTSFAQLVHKMSSRKEGKIIEISCGAIPDNLFESELFGYEAGAFTGAHKQGKPGLIERANQGTLFLDEVSELPLLMQAKLLKVLQDNKVTRVGGIQERKISFRLITATNRNLSELVEQGKFRMDLYYRLNVIPINIPALRDHKEDIPVLIHHFLEQLNQRYDEKKMMNPIIQQQLINYHWPGNVRELSNVLERLYVTSKTDIISMDQIALKTESLSENSEADRHSPHAFNSEIHNLPQAMKQLEKQLLVKAQQKCKSTYEMARYLGISQPSVVRKLKKYRSISFVN